MNHTVFALLSKPVIAVYCYTIFSKTFIRPFVPSISTTSPFWKKLAASPLKTTTGILYSRASTAPWESKFP